MPRLPFMMSSIIEESKFIFKLRKVGCNLVKLSIFAATLSLKDAS